MTNDRRETLKRALVKTQSQLDQTEAMMRDLLDDLGGGNLIQSLMLLSRTGDWDKTLEVISYGPPWIKALAGMATMNAIGAELQRLYETELLGESPQTQGEN